MISAKAPRGGLAEKLAGRSRKMILRNAEIERFEDQHCGIFQAWDGFVGKSEKPTSTQVRDIVALGLIGAGMDDEKADALLDKLGPDQLPKLYAIAQGLIGVAFMPDAADEGETPADDAQGADTEKKT